MMALARTILIGILLLIMPLVSFAEIYKYRDAQGRLTFVDDKSKVPSQFRKNVTSMTEASDSAAIHGVQNIGTEPIAAPINGTQEATAAVKKKLRMRQTPVLIHDNHVLVPVEVAMGNRVAKLSLLLDTGASATVFHRESLTELDLPSGKRFKARVAGGGTVSSERIRFRHVNVGPFQEKNAYAMVIDLQGQELPFDGMLGMDFLINHPYQVDFQNAVIIWKSID